MSAIGMGGALLSGASVEWWTPPAIFEALGLEFDLDPCGPPGGVPWIPAERTISLPDDGLSEPWTGRVWLNPPYGRETPAWVDRLSQHGDGVALVFARVDARWGQRALAAADAVCFIAGRLSFIDGHARERKGHNAANSSMLLGFGSECAEAVRSCGLGVSVLAGLFVEELIVKLITRPPVHDEPAPGSWRCGHCPYMNCGLICTKCGGLREDGEEFTGPVAERSRERLTRSVLALDGAGA